MIESIYFKGIIKYDDSDGSRIYLKNENYDIDLVSEFESFNKKQIQLNYWVADIPCNKDLIIEGWLKKIYGVVEAEYEDHYYGSWTYGPATSWGEYDYRGRLEIGGHDLFNELSEMNGKFIIIEVNIK